jgi:hypothetical protein
MCVQKIGDLSRTSVKAKSGFYRRSAVEDQCCTVFSKDSTASNREAAKEPMRRKLVWTESLSFQGWVCSECAWVFNSSWPLVGKSIEEMKTSFGQERDKKFASHVCAEHPRAAKNPD